MATGSGIYRDAASTLMKEYDEDIFRPTGMGGQGWGDDAWRMTKKAAKEFQKSAAVRDFEKGLVDKGAAALRGLADTAAGTVASTLGPGSAMAATALMDQAAQRAQTEGTRYLKQKIDETAGGRYMVAGGGLRFAGHGTRVPPGLRLAKGNPYGGALRLAGRGCGGQCGHGIRLAGSGLYKPAAIVEGVGTAYC